MYHKEKQLTLRLVVDDDGDGRIDVLQRWLHIPLDCVYHTWMKWMEKERETGPETHGNASKKNTLY